MDNLGKQERSNADKIREIEEQREEQRRREEQAGWPTLLNRLPLLKHSGWAGGPPFLAAPRPT